MAKRKKRVGFSYQVTQTWMVTGSLPVKNSEELVIMIEDGKAHFNHGKLGIVIDGQGYEVDVEVLETASPTNFKPE